MKKFPRSISPWRGATTLAALAALSALSVLSAPMAQADPNISVGVTITSGLPPPPVVRHEPVPAPRAAQIWIQGYWGWNGNAHIWIPGRWEASRPGYVYVQPEWREGPNGWELHRGGWKGGGGGGGPGHCPPGQRKKGNC